MKTDNLLADVIQGQCINGDSKATGAIADEAQKLITKYRLCFIRNFPTDPDAYIELLNHFGEPLPNYSSKSNLEKDDPHPHLNRVRYKVKKEGASQSVHYIDGELKPHSARSWYIPRPAFFSMLMVEPGWRDTPPDERGESVILSWRHLFSQLAERDGAVFEEHFERLSSIPIRFQANNVREAQADMPLIYKLPDAVDRFDVGVRLKQDLQEKIVEIRDQIPDFEKYKDSLDYLVKSASEKHFQMCFPMNSGDLIVIDNNRFAHGRRKIIGQRLEVGQPKTNPRELWSVAVANHPAGTAQ